MSDDHKTPGTTRENLKFVADANEKVDSSTVDSDSKVIDAEWSSDMAAQDEEADLQEDFGGIDENMFAQVQEMMSKMEKADELEKENADLKGRLGRLAADFENYRRRTQEDVAQAEGQGVSKAAEAMMPVFDDVQRALSIGSEDASKLIPGLQAVQNKVLTIFAGLGLEATGHAGETFDPQWHEAIQVVAGDNDDQITQVYQTGFRMGDKLVRPARVVVSKKD